MLPGNSHQTWQYNILIWLVVEPYPSEKWWRSSIGMMIIPNWMDEPLWKILKSLGITIPNIWKNKSHVPNHQPDKVSTNDGRWETHRINITGEWSSPNVYVLVDRAG